MADSVTRDVEARRIAERGGLDPAWVKEALHTHDVLRSRQHFKRTGMTIDTKRYPFLSSPIMAAAQTFAEALSYMPGFGFIEALAGSNVYGEQLSTAERFLAAATELIPLGRGARMAALKAARIAAVLAYQSNKEPDRLLPFLGLLGYVDPRPVKGLLARVRSARRRGTGVSASAPEKHELQKIARAQRELDRGQGGPEGPGPARPSGGAVRVDLTPRQAEAVGRLQKALAEGKSWADLPKGDRSVLGNLFHATVESLSEYIFQGVGRVYKNVDITPAFIRERAATGGRVLVIEGRIAVGGSRPRFDLAEINFSTGQVTVIDLTSLDRAAHVAKTKGYARLLRELTGFRPAAIEMRYIGSDKQLLETLTEVLLSE